MSENPPERRMIPSATSRESVWHYTTASGLLSIVRDHELWASSPRMVNDSSEFNYGYDLIDAAIKQITAAPVVEVGLKEFLEQTVRREFFQQEIDRVFMISASSTSDSLTHWIHYSGVKGFALEIDTSVSLAPVSSLGMKYQALNLDRYLFRRWYDMEYLETSQNEHVATVASLLKNFDEVQPNAIGESKKYIAQLIVMSYMAILKHPAFKAEHEVRFVMTRLEETPVEYREHNSRIIPYIRLIATEPDLDGNIIQRNLPIKSVTCGPGVDKREIKYLKSMLDAYGYSDVLIRPSKVPYLG
jgi:hypothetical protein